MKLLPLTTTLMMALAACDPPAESTTQRASAPPAKQQPAPENGGGGRFSQAPESPAKPPLPVTESADIKVRVLAVKTPQEQVIDTSSGNTRSSIYPKEGARLVYVSFGITPKRPTHPAPAGGGSAAGSSKEPEPAAKKDTGLASGFANMVLREGDWLFASPFASLREEPGGTSWAGGAAVIQSLSDNRTGSGKIAEGGFGADFLSIPVKEGPVITMCSLAVGQESRITLGFFVGKDTRQATVRIDGCADISISLADWGDM